MCPSFSVVPVTSSSSTASPINQDQVS
jgi:hypothetical protein